MTRRKSEAQKKKEAAEKAAREEALAQAAEGEGETTPDPEAGEGDAPPAEDPPADTPPAEDELEDLDPNDPPPAPADEVEAASSGKTLNMGVPNATRPTPNKPSFDWIEEDGKLVPNLRTDAGEEVTDEREIGGMTRVRTNQGRFIFLGYIEDYEKKVGGLPSRELYREHFPHAFKGKGK